MTEQINADDIVATHYTARAAMTKLRAPFPASETGQLPKGGTTLAYVGHAAITGRLLEVDPTWQWEPLARTETGLPLFDVDAQGRPIGLWIRLTVCGITRLGYGSCPPGQSDAVKVLVGDALRNAAMRFGVALDLWVKGSPELPQDNEPEDAPDRPVYMSAINTAAFLSKCSEAGARPADIDHIVDIATDGRTSDPNLVWADEVTVLRAAFEGWQAEQSKAAGKKVAKGVGPTTEGVTDVKTDGTLV